MKCSEGQWGVVGFNEAQWERFLKRNTWHSVYSEVRCMEQFPKYFAHGFIITSNCRFWELFFCDLCFVSWTILAVRKVGHLNIKTIMFNFEAHILICWLERVFASQPIRTRASKSNIFVFMLRWPTFLTASILFSRSSKYSLRVKELTHLLKCSYFYPRKQR